VYRLKKNAYNHQFLVIQFYHFLNLKVMSNKKNIVRILALSLIALFTVATTAVAHNSPTPSATAPLPLVLRQGTKVHFKTAERIEAKLISQYNTIELTVYQSVKVDGNYVVIPVNASAVGKIKRVVKNCDGVSCEKIVIIVESVTGIGNTEIMLKSDEHTIEAPCCNGNAVLEPGVHIVGSVLEDTRING
jgi:hypothetical protein